MKKQPDEEILEIRSFTVSLNSQNGSSHWCICTFKILFKNVNLETSPDLRKTVVRYLEQTNRENNFSSRERQLEMPASGAAAAKGKSEVKGKRNVLQT